MSTFHQVSLNRGQEGFLYSDFTTGGAVTDGAAYSSPGNFVLIVQDGKSVTKKDLINALSAFQRFVENAQLVPGSGLDVAL
jgi:hypothetical protein